MTLHLSVVGSASFKIGEQVYSQSAKHLFALVLRLALDTGHTVSREELIALLFPDARSASGRSHSLRQLLYKAKVARIPICVTADGLRIDKADITSDLEIFLAMDQSTVASHVRSIQTLKGYQPLVSPNFARWLEGVREQLDSAVRVSLVQAIESLRAEGSWARVEARSRECLSTDPLNETATLALAEALAHSGSKERALAMLSAYRKEVELEATELGLPASLVEKRIGRAAQMRDGRQGTFCGRALEMARLMYQWKRSREGAVEVSVIAGDPGFGKTRLVEEFLTSVSLGSSRGVIRVRHGLPAPFRPLAMLSEIVPALLEFPGAAGCDPELLPYLHRFAGAGVAAPAPPLLREDASLVATSIHRATVDLLRAVSDSRPVVICVDDSRAIDDTTLQFFENLRAVEGIRLHLVVQCSLAELPRLAALSNTPVLLCGLNDADSRTLLRSVATSRISDADIDWILRSAGGNPAFLRLLLSHVNHTERVRSFPADLVNAVDSSIDALPAPSRLVLEACVAVGPGCSVSLISDILGMPAYSLLIALNDLERHSFIQFEGEHICARSTLLYERVRARASSSGSGLLHARIAASLESSASETRIWDVADHWRQSGEKQKAREALSRAWRESVHLGQPDSAVSGLQNLLRDTQDSRERLALLRDLIEAARYAGNNMALVEGIKEYELLASTLGVSEPQSVALACDRIVAEFALHADPTEYDHQIQFFIRTPLIDCARRAIAAKVMLASADANCDKLMADRAFGDLQALVPDSSEAASNIDQAALIYHSTFGARDEVPQLYSRVVRDAWRVDGWIDCPRVMSAAMAMRIATSDQGHVEVLEKVYGVLLSRGMTRLCTKISAQIGSAYLDDGELAGARYWLRNSMKHSDTYSEMPLSADHIALVADLALIDGDLASARASVAFMSKSCPLFAAPRFKMALLAYEVRLLTAGAEPVEEKDVDALLSWNDRARGFGRHDDIMDAIVAGLMSAGNTLRAKALLGLYLNQHRREVRPCNFMLSSRIEAVPDFREYRRGSADGRT